MLTTFCASAFNLATSSCSACAYRGRVAITKIATTKISKLAVQIGLAEQEKDSEKEEALSRQVFELEIKLGPEFISLVSSLRDLDPNSQHAQEVDSILAPLDDSCPD